MNRRVVLWVSGFLFLVSIAFFLAHLALIDKGHYDDFPIFYHAVEQYASTGQLYTRHLEDYYPASGIYKFPSLYGSFLLPLIKNNISLQSSQTLLLYLHVGLYAISAAILVAMFMPANHRILFGLLSGILSLNLYSLYENLHTLQLEVYILFGLTAIIFLLTRQRYFLSGIVLSAMSFLKIYPVFFALYFLWKRKIAFWAGMFLAILPLVFWMVACFGWEENRWYFFEALPVMLQEGAFINHHNTGIEKLINHLFASSQFIHYETPLGVGSAAITKIILWTCCLLGFVVFFRKGNVFGSNHQHPHYMAFSLLITLCLMTLKNPWSNYQVLLVIPMLYILSLLMSLTAKKAAIFIFVLAWILLFLSPTTKSMFFSYFSETADPLFMILSLLHSKWFAMRGVATLLVYGLLVWLLFKINRPSSRITPDQS